MPPQLLPKSAAAFAPRSAPNIVLGTKVPDWLTHTLKRVSKARRPLHNVSQHHNRLKELLGGDAALWNLCSLLLPSAPQAELSKKGGALANAMSNYNMVHMQAYVVHVDMVSEKNKVAFKLTKDSISTLVDYHRDIYSVDAAASLYDWPEKDSQVKKMQEDFVQAVNRFVFRTKVTALEGLEEGGAGELLNGKSAKVKSAIMNLFAPLLPPPPRIVDVVIPATAYLQPPAGAGWWAPAPTLPSNEMSGEHWQILPSTPSPTVTQCSDPHTQFWPQMTVDPSLDADAHLPSPTPSGSLNEYSCETSLYSSPHPMPVMPVMPAYSYAGQMLPNCGSTVVTHDVDSVGWVVHPFVGPQYAATM
ncbi:hypothetical protein ANO11243_027860 [Dothideomycetidae sp. 11243]|nr:hypothetical protein ANO11243_027860 [fungal sp. No.11243]